MKRGWCEEESFSWDVIVDDSQGFLFWSTKHERNTVWQENALELKRNLYQKSCDKKRMKDMTQRQQTRTESKRMSQDKIFRIFILTLLFKELKKEVLSLEYRTGFCAWFLSCCFSLGHERSHHTIWYQASYGKQLEIKFVLCFMTFVK